MLPLTMCYLSGYEEPVSQDDCSHSLGYLPLSENDIHILFFDVKL